MKNRKQLCNLLVINYVLTLSVSTSHLLLLNPRIHIATEDKYLCSVVWQFAFNYMMCSKGKDIIHIMSDETFLLIIIL